MNKKYIIEVATNKASLEQLKKDLKAATTLPEGVEVPELSRETKAKVKKDLATLFGVADYQAEAYRNMVQAMTQGLTDSESVEKMKNQLEQTLEFTNGIMEAMQKMGHSTDWMKQGVGFVDDFIKMKDSIETVEGLEKSVAKLTTTFETFKDALAEINMDAFLQRFGNSTKADAKILAKANKELARVAKLRNEELSNIISEAKGADNDFEGDTREDIEGYYKTTIQAIQKYLKEIDALEHQYQGRTEALYKDKKYKDLLAKLSADTSYIESMPGLNTDDIGKNLKASIQEATDSVKNAGRTIQDVVDKLKGTGIELAVTFPDVTTKEFATEINKFVKKANAEFKNHPIEMTLDVASPFKKDAFKKDGTLKQLSQKQLGLSDEIAKTFRENLKTEDIEIGDDDLQGLYNVNTNVIARNIADAFNKLYKSMTAGQALITSATKKWRQTIEEDLTIKPKFDIDGAKATLDTDMAKLQEEFEVDEERWLPIHADVDGLIDEIQGELNQKTFDVKVKAGDIEGGNIIVSADQIKFGPYPQGGSSQIPLPPQDINRTTPPKIDTPSKPIEPVKVESQKQTQAITENSTVLQEGTRTQVVLTNALNALKDAMKANEGRDEISEKSIKDAKINAEKNADLIASREKSAERATEEWNRHGEKRRLLEEDKKLKEMARDVEKRKLGSLEKELFDAFKSGDIKVFEEKFAQIVEMLPKARDELRNAIESVKVSEHSDDDKQKLIGAYTSDIELIDQILEKSISPTDKGKSGRRVFYDALSAAFTYRINDLNDQITKLEADIASETKQIENYSRSSGNLRLSVNELKHAGQIERAEENKKKRNQEQSTLSSRIDKITKILDGDKDPVNLILDEVKSFWKSYTKNAVDAKKYVEAKNAELEALEDSVRGKNLDKNSEEYKEYQRRRAAIVEEKAYIDAKKKYDLWEPRRAAMTASGFDIRGMAETEVLDYLRNLLKSNPSLQTRLLNHDANLNLKSIKDLAYFIKPVQETLGVKSTTENEYMSEQELQANFKEALKVATYIEKAQGVLNNIDGDLNPAAIQDFIDYFEHIPGMANAVEHARQYLDAVKDVPEEMFDDIDPKTFLDQFKDYWSAMDNTAKSEFLGALRQTHQFDGSNITAVDDVDNWDKIFSDVLTGYREEASKLRLLSEETNNPQLQQILNVLERSTLLNQTRNAANKYGEHGIVSALFGIQNSKLVGNNSVPKNPIQMTALSKKGKTKVYTIGKQDGKKGSDKAFSWTPEQLRNAFKFANVTEEIQEIVKALFNDALIGQEELQNKIKALRSELTVLDGLGKITTDDPEKRKQQLDKFSYHAFDDTELKDSWHRKKDVESEIASIQDVLNAKLNMQVFPDKLFGDIKGLRDQKRLEREIRELRDGDYSRYKDSFKGLTQKEIGERVRNLISAKEQELEVIKVENTKTLESLLADKINQLGKLENQIIENSKKLIEAKQQELTTTQDELDQLKPIADKAQQEVDALLNKLFSSGKLKLSQGADADEAPWAGKYKYQDSELAKYENRQATNEREKERLKSQIAKLESGNYDDETKALLAENAAKEEEKAKAQHADLKRQVKNLETRISKIDQEVKDGKLKDEDGKKQKDEATASLEKARSDLTALEQKMQSGELKTEIGQAQQAYVQQLINNLKTTLASIEQDSISMNDVVQSVLVLEEDMKLSQDKAAHERSQAKGKEKQEKNLLGLTKRGNAYGNAKRKYKRALYSEAWAEHKNEEIAKYGRTSSEDSVAKVDNLLKRIQFAKTHALMDTTELEKMAAEYERLDKKYHDTEDLKALGKATEDDVKAAYQELRKYRSDLVDKFFDTEGWFKTTRLEAQFSEDEGKLREEIKKEREKDSPAKDKIEAQRKAIAAQEQKDKSTVEQYTDLLYQNYIEQPKQEIRDALKQEVDAMRSASSDHKARKDAVAQNIENDPRYKAKYKKLEAEQEKDTELAVLKKKQQELFKGNKHIGEDGKLTQEFKDIEQAIKDIRQKYTDRLTQFRDQLIEEEKKKIDAELIPDSAYSKHSVDIKTAMDNRDQAIANLQEEAKNEAKIIEELSGNEKYKSLLQEYDKLKQQGKEGSSGYKNVLAKMRGAWIEEKTKQINDAFDTFVNEVIEELFEKSGYKQDYKTSLGDRKKQVIDRLMNGDVENKIAPNTEFLNIVEAIKNEKGIDAISAKGKNKTLDYFKLSKELMARGIPDGLIDTMDLAVIADTGVRKSDDLERHLTKLKDLLFKRIKGIITNAMSQINDADVSSDAEIEAEIEALNEAAEIVREVAIERIKEKTDKELLAEESSKAASTHRKDAEDYDTRYEKDKKKRDEILQAHPEITEDVLKAAREGTLLYQETAAEEKKTAAAIEERNAAVKEWASSSESVSGQVRSQSTSGGYYYSDYGYGFGGIIDTSDLAKEGTLRGIYEVLNGGAPKGGWDDSISESTKTHESQGGSSGALFDNTVFGRFQTLAESTAALMKAAKETPHEMLSLLSKKNIITQATSGERGFIAMDDVYGALKSEKNVIRAMLHNHPNGHGMMSKDDVQNFLKLAYDESIPEKQRATVYGAYSDTELSSLNFNGITKEVAEAIINTTFSEFRGEVAKLGLTYNDKDSKYYRGDAALDTKSQEDLQLINNLEKYFYARLAQNFENFGFDKAFQYVEIDQIDSWTESVMESAKSILERARANAANGVETVSVQIPSSEAAMATSQVAEAIVENAGEAAQSAVQSDTSTNKPRSIKDYAVAASEATHKEKFINELEDKYASELQSKFNISDAIWNKSDRSVNGKSRLEAIISEIYKNNDLSDEDKSLLDALSAIAKQLNKDREKYGQQRVDITKKLDFFNKGKSTKELREQRKEADEEYEDTFEWDVWRDQQKDKYPDKVVASTKSIDTQPIEQAYGQIANTIVENAAQAAQKAADQGNTGVETIEFKDMYSLYKDVLGKFGFENVAKGKLNEVRTLMMEFLFMGIDEGLYSDLFKETTNKKNIVAASDELYKIPEMRAKIVDALFENLEIILSGNGLSDELDAAGKDNIRQYIDSVLPNSVNKIAKTVVDSGVEVAENAVDGKGKNSKPKQKTTIKKQEKPKMQDTTVDDKGVKNANDVAAAQSEAAAAADKQASANAEVAQQGAKAAESAERQASAAEQAAAYAQKQVTAESIITEEKKEANASDSGSEVSTTSNAIKVPESGNNQGGVPGLLARLATEDTLSSILSTLSNGIKVTTDKESSGGGKKGGKKKQEERPLNITADDAWTTAQAYIKENYADFTSLSALKPVSGGYSIDVFQPKNLKEFAAAQEEVNRLIAEGKRDTQEFSDAQAKLNGLKQEQEKITLRIGMLDDKVQITQEKSGFQNLALGVKAASKELQTVEGVLTQLHELGALSIDADGNYIAENKAVQTYLFNLSKLQDYQNRLSPDQLFDPAVNQQLSEYTLRLQNSRKELQSFVKDISQLNIGKKIDTDKLVGGIKGLSEDNIKNLMLDIVSDGNRLETTFKNLIPVTDDFGDVIGYEMAYNVRTGKNTVQEMTAVLNPLTNELRVQKGAVKEVATGWQAFFNGLKSKASSIMQYLISITSIQDIFRYMREGFQYVREIDSALTELKKVTDETDSSYASFLQNMSKTGSVIGATVSDLTTMAAEWARLGYSMEEAGRLAESTAVLLNVSEFQDATTASEALISTMQAFQYTADESGHVVDILNEVKVTCLRV